MLSNSKQKFLRCNCDSIEHVLRFKFFTDETNPVAHLLYIDVYLEMLCWYRRIWRAIKYMFGYRSAYGDFTEILYDKNVVSELMDFLNDYMAHLPKGNNERSSKKGE